MIAEMEKDKSQQAKELLSLIDTLYDEKTRHKGLIGRESYSYEIDLDLSEKKSEVELRTLCIYNSFGIVTILQQEILSAYKYLDNCNMPDEFEIRICNALTILRSIAGYNEIAINLASCMCDC